MMTEESVPVSCPTIAQLETIIEQGLRTFIEVGQALLEIRDRRLYREKFPTFEDYCRERWGWNRDYANKQIRAAAVVRNLDTEVSIPENERQVRPLTDLEPDDQRAVWNQAVAESPNGQPTQREVEDVKKTFAQIVRGRIRAHEGPGPHLKMTATERDELREMRAEAKAGSEWASKVMGTIGAIETLSHPPLTMQQLAYEIRRWDTPDVAWPEQATQAHHNLTQLLKELKP